jgi:hypothetical protein
MNDSRPSHSDPDPDVLMDILLFASDGVPTDQIARVLDLQEESVSRLVTMYSPISIFARSITLEEKRRHYLSTVLDCAPRKTFDFDLEAPAPI